MWAEAARGGSGGTQQWSRHFAISKITATGTENSL
jgi:hypothetical protein